MICLNIDSEISPIPPLILQGEGKVQHLAFKGSGLETETKEGCWGHSKLLSTKFKRRPTVQSTDGWKLPWRICTA